MTALVAYLTFNGNCREAMLFYQNCLGGAVSFQTVGDSPLSETMPPEMRGMVLHAELAVGNLKLMASDMTPEAGRRVGNHVSLLVECESEATCRLFFEKLADGGRVLRPLENTFWGALFGQVADRFGVEWMLRFG